MPCKKLVTKSKRVLSHWIIENKLQPDIAVSLTVDIHSMGTLINKDKWRHKNTKRLSYLNLRWLLSYFMRQFVVLMSRFQDRHCTAGHLSSGNILYCIVVGLAALIFHEACWMPVVLINTLPKSSYDRFLQISSNC